MRALFAAAVCAALLLATTAAAAEPPAQRYAETALSKAFTAWARKNLPGTTVGKVLCVLPVAGGAVAHCTVHISAPKNRENIVFKVTNTLNGNGSATFAMTSHSCTDSKTGKKLAC